MAPPPNVDQMRAEIDSGRTGEKVPFPDPAAAPLGTDAEAGGHPPQPAEVAMDMRQSKRNAVVHLGRDVGAPLYLGAVAAVSLVILVIVGVAN